MKQVGDIEIHSHFDIYTGENVIAEYVVTEEDVRVAEEQEKETNKQDILNRLAQLDIELNPARVLEDMLKGNEPTDRVKSILAEKEELRSQLKLYNN